MKIVYFCNSLENMGGIERVVIAKMNYLSDFHDIFLLTTHQKEKEYFYPLDERVKHIDFSDYGIGNLIFLQKSKFQNILKDIKPNIIVAVTGVESFLLPFLDNSIPKIKEMHFSKNYRIIQNRESNIFKRVFIWSMGKVEEKIYSLYDIVTPLTFQDAKKWNLNNLKVIYNFKTIETKEIASLEKRVVISVGRLDYQKGYDLLLKAWKIVVQKEASWKLKIYGEGTLEESLKSYAKELGISKSVLFCGSVEDIESYYLKSSIYVMSSRHEGFPLVLTEAMECGLPVVSFDCPSGPSEIIDDNKNGFLIKNGDYEMMADKVLFLIKSDELRKKMGENAKLKAKKFEKVTIMNEWLQLFKTLSLRGKNEI